jgi:hypothetical protein
MGEGVIEGIDIPPAEYERLRLEYQRDVREGRARPNRHADATAETDEGGAGGSGEDEFGI